MVFGKRAFFSYMVREDGAVWWFVNLPRSEEPTVAELKAIPDSQWHQRLLTLFAEDASPATHIISATPPNYTWVPLHDMQAPKTWYRDRAVLIGMPHT